MSTDEQRFLRELCRHFVSLSGKYINLDEAGRPVGDEIFYNYSAFVIELNGHWSLVTAAHVLTSIDEAVNHPRIRVLNQILGDFFGPDAVHRSDSIPFNPLVQPRLDIDAPEVGFDAALILLEEMYRALIAQNGVTPAPFSRNHILDLSRFSSFGIVGIPDERVGDCEVQPNYIPVRRITAEEDRRAHLQFVGDIIDMGQLASVVGMSGGPIYGFYESEGRSFYELVAIQSSWDGSGRVYGCLLRRFIDFVWAEGERRRQAGEIT